jgi:hypothetical protein
MNRAWYILLVMSILSAGNAMAQDTHGDVVIHADPRLGLLLKKERVAGKRVEKERIIAKAAIPSKDAAANAAVSVGMAAGNAAATGKPPVAAVAAPGEKVALATGKGAAPAVLPDKAATANGKLAIPPPPAAPAPPVEIPDKPVTVRTLPKMVSPPDGRVIYSGKGYRVQIYNGPDRGKALDIKMEFMRQHPAVRTYLTYVSPGFRVKVGNYRSRADAEGMYRELRTMYSPCMIVPDIITVNTY